MTTNVDERLSHSVLIVLWICYKIISKHFVPFSFTNMINFAKPFQWISFLNAEKCFHDFTWNACWLKTKMHFKWPIRNRNLFGTVNIDSECKTLGSQLDQTPFKWLIMHPLAWMVDIHSQTAHGSWIECYVDVHL